MLLVTFEKVPKGAKKYFQFKHKFSRKSPELEIKDADDAVKSYAKTLKEADTNVAFTITDDEDEDREESTFEAAIMPEDQDGGILNLIDRDLENENLTRDEEETVTNLKDQIFNELEPALSDEDSDADNLMMPNNADVYPETEPRDQSNSDVEAGEKIPPENDVPAINSAVSETPSINNNNIPAQPTIVPNMPDSPATVSSVEVKHNDVISYGKYIDANDILDRLPKGYDKNQFALSSIRHDLGYLDTPRDQYDQKLNDKIDQFLREYSMQDIQREYDEGLAKSKVAIIDRLKEAYNRINQEPLDKIIENKTASKVLDLKAKANQRKQNNSIDLKKLKETKALELKNNDEAALAEFKKQLEEKRNLALKNFNDQEELRTRNANERIDEQLKSDQAKVKSIARDEEVQKRNSALDDDRTTISNNFDHAVRLNYDKHNDLFEQNIKKVQEKVQIAKEEINKQRQLDLEKAEEKRQREAEAARKERELDLKQKAIEQNESLAKLQQENMAKLPEQFAKAIAEAITQNNLENPNVKITLNGEGKDINLPVPHVQGQIVDLDDKGNRIKTPSQPETPEDSDLEGANDNSKIRKKNYKVGIISLVGLAALSGLGTWAYISYSPKNGNKVVVEQSKLHVKEDTKSDNKKANDKASQSKIYPRNKGKNNLTVTHLTRTQAVLKQYREANTWAQKRDVLDGLLGQGDARNLKKIATTYPSTIASLYSAIASDDKAQTRNIWLSMSDEHRTEISNAAKRAVSLAFYDVADWQDGWMARYAY
ncbi:hypothetical protein [Lactobacillus sp. HT06-2]|uniref:hypothetical protein n=1 Tax=Lactobacillus sp. HT06-2 TaxID=2080222 RepID=UPI000CD83EA8|nr:hypothetical protein [Lactobacillus sp. HT06-2]